ncbi:MAG: hypothetical protein JXB49_32380 [Bacteroidales bacterium]|nr:hypothetical protein [Bacteroidales bacterium]
MQEFVLTSTRFSGSMRLGYCNGILEQFENNTDLNEAQLDYFTRNFPLRLATLEAMKGVIVKEVTDLSFEAFWSKYDYKVDKQQAEKFWNKMTRPDKLAALAGITKYRYGCRLKNTAMIYPVRYLRNRRWEDE